MKAEFRWDGATVEALSRACRGEAAAKAEEAVVQMVTQLVFGRVPAKTKTKQPRIRRRRIEPGLVGLARLYGPLHLVIDLQDNPLGAVIPVGRFVLASHDKESLIH